MAKLYFKYGAMGSSKTANALITKFNYEERGMRVWLIKPAIDTRDGAGVIRSRIGLEANAQIIGADTDIYAEMAEGFYNCYRDCGWLPKWLCPDNRACMPGMLVEATLADAIVKEIVDCDLAERIFEAMLKDGEVASETKRFGRKALAEYRKYGYIPHTAVKERVAHTGIENAVAIFFIQHTVAGMETLGRFARGGNRQIRGEKRCHNLR